MEVIKNISTAKMNKIVFVLMIVFLGISSESYASVDTTLFRIKSLQDTVDAGDTIDVDLFIGDANHLADSIKEFELEIEYDLDICDKNHIDFKLDSTSLAAFFGTTFSNAITITTTNGHVNIKVNCNTIGRGTARIGRVKYIVQDNVNGRQLLRFDFFKLSAKRLSGGGNDKPVRMLGDSVMVIRGFNQLPTSVRNNETTDRVKIYPNPFTDYLQIEGTEVQQYQLLSMNGSMITIAENFTQLDKMLIDIRDLNAGNYVLQLRIKNEWKSYQILKE